MSVAEAPAELPGENAWLSVVVADDHPLFREGIEAVLHRELDIRVVGQASEGDLAVATILKHRPEVSLVDLRMPPSDGVDVVKRVRATWPDAKIVILSSFDPDHDIELALRAGARGYLLKDTLGIDLVRAIRDVHAGRTCLSPSVAGKLADGLTRLHLTVRELQVLRMVAEGRGNKHIAGSLGISEGTIKLHLNHLFQKLDVRSRTEAVKVGLERGLLRHSTG